MKASQIAWNGFLRTGNISDYLNYRELLRLESSGELTPGEEDSDAPEHKGNSDKGDSDGRK